jgi:hypothetical protein
VRNHEAQRYRHSQKTGDDKKGEPLAKPVPEPNDEEHNNPALELSGNTPSIRVAVISHPVRVEIVDQEYVGPPVVMSVVVCIG